jgi:predicted Zn-dependent protease
MSKINWVEKLNWTDEHMEDLCYTGYSYIRQGKYDIALAFFEALAILEPHNPYHLQTLGAVYLELNQPAKALQYFDRALKLEHHHSPTLLNLAKAFFVMDKREEALKLVHILKMDSNLTIANTAKALILAYN